MPHNVETMFSVREVPWHGLGTIVQEAPDSEQALVLAGLDWAVVQRPIYTRTSEGGFEKVPDYQLNVRITDGQVLGVVGDRYRIVQNRQAFGWVDELLKAEEVRYETAGSLRNGRQIWLLARMNRYVEVLGDEVCPYLLFTNSHDGRGAVRVQITPIRVVCQNTLNLALRGRQRAWAAIHVGDFYQRLEEARRTLGLALHYLEGLEEEAQRLAEVPVPDSRWEQLIEQLIPVPEGVAVGSQRWKNLDLLRQDLRMRRNAPDLLPYRHTGWAAINAVADHVAHREPLRIAMGAGISETRFTQVMNGHPMLDEAYRLLLRN